jgi:hypothetical protein
VEVEEDLILVLLVDQEDQEVVGVEQVIKVLKDQVILHQ